MADGWGLLRNEGGASKDFLLEDKYRYPTPEKARIGAWILAGSFIKLNDPEGDRHIGRSRMANGQVIVANRETGQTYFTLRPVRVDSWVAGQGREDV